MACSPLGSDGRWAEELRLEIRKINLQMDGLGRPFCEVSASEKGEHRGSANFGNKTSLYQEGIQQVPSSKCLYNPQLIDRNLNDQKIMRDPKGLLYDGQLQEGTREDSGITSEAFTVSLGLSQKHSEASLKFQILGRVLQAAMIFPGDSLLTFPGH